jgi:hypothetical protein
LPAVLDSILQNASRQVGQELDADHYYRQYIGIVRVNGRRTV